MPDPQEIVEFDKAGVIRAMDHEEVALSYYAVAEHPGVYLHWDRRFTGGAAIAYYQVLRGENFEGAYVPIATLEWPTDEWIDLQGHPSFFYKVRELAADGSVLGTGAPMHAEELLIKASLAVLLKDLLNYNIYNEECRFLASRTRGDLVFHNWNYFPRPQIEITGLSIDGDRDSWLQLSEDTPIFKTANDPAFSSSPFNNYPNGLQYTTDYQGHISFFQQDGVTPTSIQQYDNVRATYNVRLFSGTEMNTALKMALYAVNAEPGSGKYPTVASSPFYYEPYLVVGAAAYLLKGLRMGMMNREKRMLIQDPEQGAYDMLAYLKELQENFDTEFEKGLKALPKSVYPRLGSIVTPEFILPGGRSRFYRAIWKGGMP